MAKKQVWVASPFPTPRQRAVFCGHGLLEKKVLNLLSCEKLPHALLLSGPYGVGKATFAYRLARFLLAFGASPAPTLDLNSDHPVFKWVASGAHPDLLTLEKSEKRDIVVDDVRRCGDFFSLTAGGGGYRIVIIDCADDLTPSASHALLKSLEEPPEKGLFLLISHRPARLLPTIVSRCICLPFLPLSREDVLRSLDLEASPELEWILNAAKGSPGRGAALLHSSAATLFRNDFEACLSSGARQQDLLAHRVASLEMRSDVDLFCDLMLAWVREQGRAGLVNNLIWAEAYAKIQNLLEEARLYNLDVKQALILSFSVLEGGVIGQ